MSSPIQSSRRKIAAALVAAGVGAFTLAAGPAAAMHGHGATEGHSDQLVPPPAPSCVDPVFVTTAGWDAAGNPLGAPRFGTSPGMTLSLDVPVSFTAGTVSFDEIITFDGYQARADLPAEFAQTGERVYFELLLDGEVQASTLPTHDLADNVRSVWSVADLGPAVLDEGADTLRIRHIGDTSSPNSLIVSGVCLSHAALPAEVEPEPEPEPEEPVVAPPSTVPTPPATTPPVEVLPGSQIQEPVLALTGSDDSTVVMAGIGLIVAGLALVAAERRLTGSPIR